MSESLKAVHSNVMHGALRMKPMLQQIPRKIKGTRISKQHATLAEKMLIGLQTAQKLHYYFLRPTCSCKI